MPVHYLNYEQQIPGCTFIAIIKYKYLQNPFCTQAQSQGNLLVNIYLREKPFITNHSRNKFKFENQSEN